VGGTVYWRSKVGHAFAPATQTTSTTSSPCPVFHPGDGCSAPFSGWAFGERSGWPRFATEVLIRTSSFGGDRVGVSFVESRSRRLHLLLLLGPAGRKDHVIIGWIYASAWAVDQFGVDHPGMTGVDAPIRAIGLGPIRIRSFWLASSIRSFYPKPSPAPAAHCFQVRSNVVLHAC